MKLVWEAFLLLLLSIILTNAARTGKKEATRTKKLKVDVKTPNQTEAKRAADAPWWKQQLCNFGSKAACQEVGKRDYSVKRHRRQIAWKGFLNSISAGKSVQIGSKTFIDVNDKEDKRNGGKLRHFWKYARQACQHLGGDLPSDLSYKDVDLLYAAFGGTLEDPKDFWVGAKAPEGEDSKNEWRWVSGNRLSPNYKKWRNTDYDEELYVSHENQPKSSKYSELCAFVRKNGDERAGDGPSLDTWSCSRMMMGVVCQMKQTSHSK